MNPTLKLILALAVGIAAGVLLSNVYVKQQKAQDDPFERVMAEIDSVDWKLVRSFEIETSKLDTRHQAVRKLMNKMGGSPIAWECVDKPTRHIDKEKALDFIQRYQNGPLQLYTHRGEDLELLQGWFLESDTVLKVLSRHPDANGLQLYLARKNAYGYDPMTIVWMARNRKMANYCEDNTEVPATTAMSEEEGAEGEDQTYWDDAYEYLQPCPPNCPKR